MSPDEAREKIKQIIAGESDRVKKVFDLALSVEHPDDAAKILLAGSLGAMSEVLTLYHEAAALLASAYIIGGLEKPIENGLKADEMKALIDGLAKPILDKSKTLAKHLNIDVDGMIATLPTVH